MEENTIANSTKEQKTKKNWMRKHPKLTALICVFLFLWIVGLIGETTDKKKATTNAAVTSMPTDEPTATPKPLSMNDKLWAAFNKILDDRYKKGTEIKYTDIDKTVVLIEYPGKYWSETNLYDLDEKRLVETAISTFVSYGQEAFKIDGVNRVGVDYRMPFTDSYGKETTSTAFSFSMTKEEFQKYNWDNLKGKSIYLQIIRSTEADPMFSIKPSVLSKINPEDILLH